MTNTYTSQDGSIEGLLASSPDAAFDRLTRLAAALLSVPMSAISLFNESEGAIRSAVGMPKMLPPGVTTNDLFCRNVCLMAEPLIIQNTNEHELAQNSQALTMMQVQAYAGIPLVISTGQSIGALCVMDVEYREWSAEEMLLLSELATAAMLELELRLKVRCYETVNRLLESAHARLEQHMAQRTEELRITSLHLQDAIAEQETTAARLRDSEAYLRIVMETTADAIVLANQRGVIVYWNDAAERLFGYTASEVIGQSVEGFMPSRYGHEYLQAMQDLDADDVDDYQNLVLEFQGLHRSGREFPIELLVGAWEIQGEIYFNCVVRDITQRKQAEHDLQQAARDFRGLFEHAHDAIVIIEPFSEVVLEVNQRAVELYGYAREEFIGMSMQDISQNHERGSLLSSQILAGEPASKVETTQFRKDGSTMFLEINATLVEFQGRTAILSINRDITERKAFESRLSYLAFHDTLTGLPNRTWLTERMNEPTTAGKQRSTALLLIELDRHTLIANSLGPALSDQLILHMSHYLRSLLNSDEHMVRVGESEFALLVPVIDRSSTAVFRAEHIIQQASTHEILIGQHRIYTSLSIGVAVTRAGLQSPAELLRDAGNALALAKSKGHSRIEVFDHSMSVRALERLKLEQDLRYALLHNEMEVYYQPVVSLDTKRLHKVEALVRWNHPEQGVISPVVFIPLAEETGLILTIGAWVLRQACTQVQQWNMGAFAHAPIGVNVNLSALQFFNTNLTESIAQVLAETGLAPHLLTLEITESIAMDDPAPVVTILNQLKQLGVQIALDDFGTGYSSLSYLKRFPLDMLKIDKSFVMGVPDDEEGTAITETIVALARTLRMQVVAEGIESALQYKTLLAMGCSLGQGYYFAKPMSAAALSSLFPGWHGGLVPSSVSELLSRRVTRG